MDEKIGQAAGAIWHTLANASKPMNITDIPKKSKLSTPLAYQGLGWLAREGKIQYHQQGRTTLVSLAGAECVC
jgi:hypothetical protein